MSICEVEHQRRGHRIVQRALACQRMPHAYLFAGPSGVGKEMLATGLAQTLLCESPVRRPLPESVAGATDDGRGLDACGTCQDCRLVNADTHPDLKVVYRQLNKQHPDSAVRKQKALVLGVEVIRHFLVDKVGTRPSRGRARVFIVREAERLNEAAQNSLLKTLEEPPKDTFIILLTDAMDRMLPTTRSRCQHVLFRSLPTAYVAQRLRTLRPEADAKEIAYVAEHAGGSLGAALRDLDDGVYALKRAWGGRLVELADAGRQAASGAGGSAPCRLAPHELAKPFSEDARALGKCVVARDPEVSETDAMRVGLQTLLGVLADFYVDALRKATGARSSPINADQPGVVDQLAAVQSDRALVSALNHLWQAEANISRNAHVELTLETLFLRLAGAVRSST